MNLGIYINSLANQTQLQHIGKLINNNINKSIDDASIFFDGIAHVPYQINCGFFNSTDLWNFKGNLIVTSLENIFTAINVVNNIDIYYYYNWEENKNTLKLLELLSKNIKIICRNENDSKELYRITGYQSLGISDNFDNIVNIIAENSNGRFKNSQDVCRSA